MIITYYNCIAYYNYIVELITELLLYITIVLYN